MSAEPQKRPASCREFIEDLTGKSSQRLPAVDTSALQQELWYLVYKDENGAPHTVKGTISAVRRSLRDGHLGDASNVRASRTKAGPFEPLSEIAEFREFVKQPVPSSADSASRSGAKGAPTKRPAPSSAAVPETQTGKPKTARPTMPMDEPRKQRTTTLNSFWTSRKVWIGLLFFALFILSAVSVILLIKLV